MTERDHIRLAVLTILQNAKKPLSRELVYSKIATVFRNVTENQVWAAMIELSLEGLIKVDYEPILAITQAGREVKA